MATLYIIAGPNGAGKSTNSASILKPFNLTAFDYDKELEIVWERFGFDLTIEGGVRDSVDALFYEKKDLAILSKSDFAFETNYHHESTPLTVARFKDAGFQTVMIFFALLNEETAIERVKQRVSQGGHSVDEQTIRERYQKGLQKLDETFDVFDRVHLLLSLENKTELILTLESQQKIVHRQAVTLMEKLPRMNSFINAMDKDKELE